MKTKADKFRALFPLKGNITKDILKTADRDSIRKCVGALTLKAALKKNIKLMDYEIGWGDKEGANLAGGESFDITTKENISMMNVRKPRKVTFILKTE